MFFSKRDRVRIIICAIIIVIIGSISLNLIQIYILYTQCVSLSAEQLDSEHHLLERAHTVYIHFEHII